TDCVFANCITSIGAHIVFCNRSVPAGREWSWPNQVSESIGRRDRRWASLLSGRAFYFIADHSVIRLGHQEAAGSLWTVEKTVSQGSRRSDGYLCVLYSDANSIRFVVLSRFTAPGSPSFTDGLHDGTCRSAPFEIPDIRHNDKLAS